MQDLCKSSNEEFVKLIEEAEKKMNLKIVQKENLLKRKTEDKVREINDLNEATAIIEQKKQKLN